MRTVLFRKILRSLERRTPDIIASVEIQILLDTTARGFGVKGKRVWNHRPQRALREYSDFTVSCMKRGETDADRLYAEAFRTGSMVRRVTGFRSSRDIEKLVFYLYSNIGIAMYGYLPGEVIVRECRFSRFYTPEQCLIMSSVDSGIIAGIAGGGRLDFTERLTEGNSCCRAYFSKRLQSGTKRGNDR